MYIFSKKNCKRQSIIHNDPIYSTWSQPNLTGYGTVGSDDFAMETDQPYHTGDGSYATWRMFDGETSSNANAGCINKQKTACYILLYTNTATKFNSLTFQNRMYANCAPRTMTFWESSDGSSWTSAGSYTNATLTANSVWSCNWSPTGTFKYHKIEFGNDWTIGAGNSAPGVQEIWISAEYISGYNTWEEEL